jgi:hypothetical protein
LQRTAHHTIEQHCVRVSMLFCPISYSAVLSCNTGGQPRWGRDRFIHFPSANSVGPSLKRQVTSAMQHSSNGKFHPSNKPGTAPKTYLLQLLQCRTHSISLRKYIFVGRCQVYELRADLLQLVAHISEQPLRLSQCQLLLPDTGLVSACRSF